MREAPVVSRFIFDIVDFMSSASVSCVGRIVFEIDVTAEEEARACVFLEKRFYHWSQLAARYLIGSMPPGCDLFFLWDIAPKSSYNSIRLPMPSNITNERGACP